MGTDLQHLLGRRLFLHPGVPPLSDERRKGPHRQHEQRQRILGFGPTAGAATAYSAAKFAVKGFTEALITDLRLNAPHIQCSVVMPGHIGTSIVANSRKIQFGTRSDAMSSEEIAHMRARLSAAGRDLSQVSDADLQKMAAERARRFREEAPMTAAEAATVILDGVKANRWRILVGRDAHRLDELVRQAPEAVYEEEFFAAFAAEAGWAVGR